MKVELTGVKLTDIFAQELSLTEDLMGCWTLEDEENDLFLQSDYDREAWADLLIIKDGNDEWVGLTTYLKNDTLSDWTHEVRATPDD